MSNISFDAITGICSSLPPWMMSNGASNDSVKAPGSFCLSRWFHSGTVAGSAFWRVEKSTPADTELRYPVQPSSTLSSQARPAVVSTLSSGASVSPKPALSPAAAMPM